MDFIDRLGVVLSNKAFWAALWALVQALVAYFFPTFPPELLAAINLFVAALFGLFFMADAGEARAFARMQREMRDAQAWGSDDENEDEAA